MTITLYRSDCYLFHADGWPIVSWSDWSFEPISGAERGCESGNRKVRDCPLPFAVKIPPLAKLERGRLIESGDQGGLDAASVWWLAARGERGFRIQESTDVKQQSLFDNQPPPADEIEAPISSPPPADEIERLCLIITTAKMWLLRADAGKALEALNQEAAGRK